VTAYAEEESYETPSTASSKTPKPDANPESAVEDSMERNVDSH
jgi:hypothetical protein